VHPILIEHVLHMHFDRPAAEAEVGGEFGAGEGGFGQQAADFGAATGGASVGSFMLRVAAAGPFAGLRDFAAATDVS